MWKKKSGERGRSAELSRSVQPTIFDGRKWAVGLFAKEAMWRQRKRKKVAVKELLKGGGRRALISTLRMGNKRDGAHPVDDRNNLALWASAWGQPKHSGHKHALPDGRGGGHRSLGHPNHGKGHLGTWEARRPACLWPSALSAGGPRAWPSRRAASPSARIWTQCAWAQGTAGPLNGLRWCPEPPPPLPGKL